MSYLFALCKYTELPDKLPNSKSATNFKRNFQEVFIYQNSLSKWFEFNYLFTEIMQN